MKKIDETDLILAALLTAPDGFDEETLLTWFLAEKELAQLILLPGTHAIDHDFFHVLFNVYLDMKEKIRGLDK